MSSPLTRAEIARRIAVVVAAGKADEGNDAAGAKHAGRLLEGPGGNGGDDGAVGSSDLFLDDRARVGVARVHQHFGAVLPRELQLVIGDVDGRHPQAHGAGVLHGDVTEPADAEHGDPLARAGRPSA